MHWVSFQYIQGIDSILSPLPPLSHFSTFSNFRILTFLLILFFCNLCSPPDSFHQHGEVHGPSEYVRQLLCGHQGRRTPHQTIQRPTYTHPHKWIRPLWEWKRSFQRICTRRLLREYGNSLWSYKPVLWRWGVGKVAPDLPTLVKWAGKVVGKSEKGESDLGWGRSREFCTRKLADVESEYYLQVQFLERTHEVWGWMWTKFSVLGGITSSFMTPST